MLFSNKGTRGEGELTALFDLAQVKLNKQHDKSNPLSNGYSLHGDLTPNSGRSVDFMDQVSVTCYSCQR